VEPIRGDMVEGAYVDVRHLGTVPYQEAMEQMKALQTQRINDEIPDTLLILQHPEIVTVGPRARNDGIAPPQGYTSQAVDRGGGLTWHGPGQLVAYPIFKWNKEGETSVAAIIKQIEAWVIAALEQCSIKGARDERMQGVWVDGKKVCSIGLSFLRWTSRHGFTINIDTPKGRVEGIAGCGLDEATTTCLSRLGYSVTMQEMLDALMDTMLQIISRSIS
jgi:lipoyl(octanoyl) transferase